MARKKATTPKAEPKEDKPRLVEKPKPVAKPGYYYNVEGTFILPDGRVIDSTNRDQPLDEKALNDLASIKTEGDRCLMEDMLKDGRILEKAVRQ